jgi:hypothetical protein
MSTSSESEIDDIFRDLTISHRSVSFGEEEKETKPWQIALASALGLGIIVVILWYFLRG